MSLLAIASCQSNDLVLNHRNREQAHSYRLNAVCLKECDRHCGSGLARESGGSGNEDVECEAAFASRLAPTDDRVLPEGMRSKCGSGLARESGGSGNADVECEAAFASKLAPTGERVLPEGMRSKAVGVSLLAIASCQSNDLVLTHCNREQAHSYRLNAVCLKECDQNVGAGLLAKAAGQAMKLLNVKPSSRASSLPQGYGVIWKAMKIPPSDFH